MIRTIKHIFAAWLLALACLPALAQKSWQTSYMQLNPTIMGIYHELDSIFPLRYLANESPADCGYWVNYDFSSFKEFKLYQPWLESLLKRMDKVDAYSRVTIETDSVSKYTHAIELNLTTPNNIQKDRCYLYVTNNKVSFHYRAKIESEEYKYQNKKDDPNGQPRQDIADNMDALLNKYIHRKNVKADSVFYDSSKRNYRYVSFSSKYELARGCRYIVPNCKESDYQKFQDAIRSYARINPVRTSCNDVYWQYDESAICVFRPNNPNPLIVAAALKGTDLYLIRLEGIESCFLPRAWAEESPVLENKEFYKAVARKPLAPPAIKGSEQ